MPSTTEAASVAVSSASEHSVARPDDAPSSPDAALRFGGRLGLFLWMSSFLVMFAYDLALAAHRMIGYFSQK